MTNLQDTPTRGPSSPANGASRLEQLTLVHVGVLVVGSTWALGGNTASAGSFLAIWGSLGATLTVAALGRANPQASTARRRAKWLWPLLAFNVFVIASCFNPSFRAVSDGARTLFVEDSSSGALPSSAIPGVSLRALWFFDAAYLSCFNLLLIIRHRRSLRVLLAIVLTNTVLLAIFGTMQKLMGATGLFFGLVKSPQLFFFASFFYHNHWGAYVVLMMAAALGLAFRDLARDPTFHLRHSPAVALLLAVLLIGASLPLSGSRSCTIMGLGLVAWAFLHWTIRIRRVQQGRKRMTALPLAAAAAAVVIALGFVYSLARPIIKPRIAATQTQIAELKGTGSLGSRALLYRDTWNMAREKLCFGWGMGSFPTVFFQRNTQRYSHTDGLPMYFEDAHSDWLQSTSELGLIGMSLLGLCGLVPLYRCRHMLTRSPLTGYLLGGCGLILLYAWLEFPFGNRAVVIAFWLCFFCAVTYGKAETSSSTSS